MSEGKPPNPLTDVRKGLALLFRAARTTARKLPTTNLGKELEEAVVTSAREVGRAIENVATTIEREVRGRSSGESPRDPHQNTPKNQPDTKAKKKDTDPE